MTASTEAKAQLKALVDPRLHKATKMLAVSRGVTISALVETLLEQELEQVPNSGEHGTHMTVAMAPTPMEPRL